MKNISTSQEIDRKLKFMQIVQKYKTTKTTRGNFDILKIFIMATIFRPKIAILGHFTPKNDNNYETFQNIKNPSSNFCFLMFLHILGDFQLSSSIYFSLFASS